MAKTTAIDSKQCRRAKPESSPALLCALGSRFWGESPDDNVISRLSSGYLGRKPGREKFFLHLIRISGEISRTSVAPPYTLERLWAKSDRGVSKKVQNIVFGYRLVIKQAKSGQGVSGQAQISVFYEEQSQQAEVRMFYDMLYQ